MAKKAQDGESIAGYFKKIFLENPKLLKKRSNAEILDRWLADHPDEKEVPLAVKNGLANTKSVLRSKKRRRKKTKAEGPAAPVATAPRSSIRSLEALEAQIDDALMVARKMDGLEEVVDMLRRARNKVVWQLGL